jgi:hypothetical protein
MSFKTFYKYKKLNNFYKKPHGLTDLCEFCEEARKLYIRIAIKLQDYPNYKSKSVIDVPDLIKFFKKEYNEMNRHSTETEKIQELTSIISQLKDLEAMFIHKKVAKSQRAAYQFQRNSKEFLKDKILIDVDYKQKIVVGKGPRQVNADYYKQAGAQRTCLGFFLNKNILNNFFVIITLIRIWNLFPKK